ncbi:hypothetical protein [Candidatus Phyllobacterium onerii]|uniref:hypothetical protein n=1 Tax=Candidatus Phyllobacterium onerii TaxID=3020828 RepID=UPI00232AFAB1|nr:hypothetical protein [Phyllobacterium sp. IY22]
MADTLHPAAIEHLPGFVTGPGESDWLFTAVAVFLLAAVLMIGNFYFQVHALPEQMAHRTKKVQMEIVAVLALISLFTHNHIFWIAGLLLAFIDLPDFSTPMSSMAQSLERLSGRTPAVEDPVVVTLLPKPKPDTVGGGI